MDVYLEVLKSHMALMPYLKTPKERAEFIWILRLFGSIVLKTKSCELLYELFYKSERKFSQSKLSSFLHKDVSAICSTEIEKSFGCHQLKTFLKRTSVPTEAISLPNMPNNDTEIRKILRLWSGGNVAMVMLELFNKGVGFENMALSNEYRSIMGRLGPGWKKHTCMLEICDCKAEVSGGAVIISNDEGKKVESKLGVAGTSVPLETDSDSEEYGPSEIECSSNEDSDSSTLSTKTAKELPKRNPAYTHPKPPRPDDVDKENPKRKKGEKSKCDNKKKEGEEVEPKKGDKECEVQGTSVPKIKEPLLPATGSSTHVPFLGAEIPIHISESLKKINPMRFKASDQSKQKLMPPIELSFPDMPPKEDEVAPTYDRDWWDHYYVTHTRVPGRELFESKLLMKSIITLVSDKKSSLFGIHPTVVLSYIDYPINKKLIDNAYSSQELELLIETIVNNALLSKITSSRTYDEGKYPFKKDVDDYNFSRLSEMLRTLSNDPSLLGPKIDSLINTVNGMKLYIESHGKAKWETTAVSTIASSSKSTEETKTAQSDLKSCKARELKEKYGYISDEHIKMSVETGYFPPEFADEQKYRSLYKK